jgi:glycine oxidase
LTKPVEIRRNKGELIEIAAPGLQEGFILKGEVFVLPLGDGRFRVGATYSHDTLDNEPTAAGLTELTTKLEKMIVVPYTVTSHRAGLRPTTYDRQPVIGPIPGNPQISVLNGFGSRGVLQAPWYAGKMAQWIMTTEKLWPKTKDTGRYF